MDDAKIHQGRRRALKTVGGMGAALLTGQAISQTAEPQVAQGLLAFKAPAARVPAMPPYIIDAHAHFFNASDVDGYHYLLHSIGHKAGPLAKAVVPFKRVIARISENAQTAKDELAELEQIAASLAPLDSKQRADRIEKIIDFKQTQNIAEVHDAIRDSHAEMAFAALVQTLEREEGLAPSNQKLSKHTDDAMRYLQDKDGKRGGIGSRLVSFIACMRHDRWINLATYQRNVPGVNAVFDAMVDFRASYDMPHSDFKDQVAVHRRMSQLSDGAMLPLVAYNPLADMKSDGEVFDIVKKAIREQGFIGVKIYPPMGFRPYGNAQYPIKGMPDLQTRQRIDRHMLALFEFCADEGVPVMAHANRTEGVSSAYDVCSEPKGWEALIKAMQPARMPNINLGHFGGAGKSDWPTGFARLMAQTGGARIYGDVGKWSSLRKCGADVAACKPVARLTEAAKAFGDTGAFNQRIMYGSDWFMDAVDRDWQHYPEQVARALAGTMNLRQLFYQNAIDCFGLGTDGKRRASVAAHLGQLPAWLA